MDTTVFYWGPLLTRSEITAQQLKIVQEICDQSKIDTVVMEHNLYSKLNTEMVLVGTNKEKFLEIIDPHTKNFLKIYDSFYTNSGKLPCNHVEYDGVWSNFQQKGEYRPPHHHNGDFSYILYVDIPEELKKEFEENYYSGQKRGSIVFTWASDSSGGSTSYIKPNNTFDFFPKNGDLYIFPSYLSHYSMNFFSDCVRVSVSGNAFLA